MMNGSQQETRASLVRALLGRLPGNLFDPQRDYAGGKWYECAPPYPERAEAEQRTGAFAAADVAGKKMHTPRARGKKGAREADGPLNRNEYESLLDHADLVLELAANEYVAWLKRTGQQSSLQGRNAQSKSKFRVKAEKGGTQSDQFAALTLSVQESPVHHAAQLAKLLSLAAEKNRRDRVQCLSLLHDLFVHDLLPNDRTLRPFESIAAKMLCASPRESTGASDALQVCKEHILYALYEHRLKQIYGEFLSELDKFAQDPISQLRERAVGMLGELLRLKPEREQRVLGVLVNKLGDADHRVASKVAHQLHLVLNEHPQMKLVIVREVGQLVSRPHPSSSLLHYASVFLNQLTFESRVESDVAAAAVRIYLAVFSLCMAAHSTPSSHDVMNGGEDGVKREGKKRRHHTAKKGKKHKSATDRMKTGPASPAKELTETKLVGLVLSGLNRALPYAEQSLSKDTSGDYAKQFDEIFRLVHTSRMGTIVQALTLLQRASQTYASIEDRFYRAAYEQLANADLLSQTKTHAMFLNVIYLCMLRDTCTARLLAFAKRLLQAALHGTAAFAAGALMIVSEVLAREHRSVLKLMVAEPEQSHVIHGKKDASIIAGAASGQAKQVTSYVINGREPLYAGAELSCLWELSLLCNHHHPSISKFAQTLFTSQSPIKYDGDPLRDFCSSTFLDRFVLKKPKQTVLRSLHQREASVRDSIASKSFQERMAMGKLAEDEQFYARFFERHPLKRYSDAADDDAKPFDVHDDEDLDKAFDAALREEMGEFDSGDDDQSRGSGSDMGSNGNGQGHDAGVEDDDDEAAFQKALAEEMGLVDDDDLTSADSAAESSDGEAEALWDQRSGDKRRNNEEEETNEKKKKKKSGGSAFAAAEDYEELIDAIEKEMDGEGEEGEEEEGEDKEMDFERIVSRKGSDKDSEAERLGFVSAVGKHRKKRRRQ
ncbi:Ribosome biogenesis protein NOC1 [Porphyridium purpureum]|uniref:Ribosome biogenesis protein NOC1 n=1 Tax=Porphyridium purpureum TaxID=35688 RepID=A0A5J4YJJ3_PORPP|nr:Ribosome biogenesis protein NOC1 [Porphyridium purpureum]|eukprot:POR4582..scf297_16